ncbi:MAG: hypothetical protein JWO85_3028 [Candidatus Eremiobacteraeota bacterium]|jgi:hypothetical protein|nr:hypothetical protein [Candidatus Eremiobacteraeota bacterium]
MFRGSAISIPCNGRRYDRCSIQTRSDFAVSLELVERLRYVTSATIKQIAAGSAWITMIRRLTVSPP